MLKTTVEQALNKQINGELYSAYLYLAMSTHLQSLNYIGGASWFRVQAQEEMSHVMKLYDYVMERGGKAELTAIEAPPAEWESPLAAFEAAYQHELHVSGLINKLVDLAIKESDHATNNMLQWFVAEQVEEEASANEIVQKLKLAGNDGGGLLIIDQELAGRTLTLPAAEA